VVPGLAVWLVSRAAHSRVPTVRFMLVVPVGSGPVLTPAGYPRRRL